MLFYGRRGASVLVKLLQNRCVHRVDCSVSHHVTARKQWTHRSVLSDRVDCSVSHHVTARKHWTHRSVLSDRVDCSVSHHVTARKHWTHRSVLSDRVDCSVSHHVTAQKHWTHRSVLSDRVDCSVSHHVTARKQWTHRSVLSNRQPHRQFSSTSRNKTKKVVYVSTSDNIFENLALEEWLYENMDMSETDYLLMWRNSPAVVIGRHQNPWLECNVQEAVRSDVALARRNSGGGTVYHDEGNLNLSFLMNRSRYDRRKNLSQVVAALTSRWDLDLQLNCRDDLVLDGVHKVSGTASKLTGNRTYHHFTLVVDINTDVLASILSCPLLGVDSNATQSVPSPVKNLKVDAPDMTFDLLVKVIGQHFMTDENKKEFMVVDPNEESRFPGVAEIQGRYLSWSWVFGKTPRFTVTRTFTASFPGSHALPRQYSLRTQVVIDKGKLAGISVHLSGKSKARENNKNKNSDNNPHLDRFSAGLSSQSADSSVSVNSPAKGMISAPVDKLGEASADLSSGSQAEEVDLPFPLLELLEGVEVEVEVEGGRRRGLTGVELEEGRLSLLWEACRARLREAGGEGEGLREGGREGEDVELLLWGLDCVISCVPVGNGPVVLN